MSLAKTVLAELRSRTAQKHAKPIARLLGVEKFAQKWTGKGLHQSFCDVSNAATAEEVLKRLPAPGEYFHIIVGNEFAGFDLIPAMLSLSGARKINRLVLTTLGFSRKNIAHLAGMFRAGILKPGNVMVLCSDFFRKSDEEIWAFGAGKADEEGYGFRSFRNHTKIILCQIGSAFYVIESSANLRSCQNIEQFTMTNSRGLFNFHRAWIERVFEISQP